MTDDGGVYDLVIDPWQEGCVLFTHHGSIKVANRSGVWPLAGSHEEVGDKDGAGADSRFRGELQLVAADNKFGDVIINDIHNKKVKLFQRPDVMSSMLLTLDGRVSGVAHCPDLNMLYISYVDLKRIDVYYLIERTSAFRAHSHEVDKPDKMVCVDAQRTLYIVSRDEEILALDILTDNVTSVYRGDDSHITALRHVGSNAVMFIDSRVHSVMMYNMTSRQLIKLCSLAADEDLCNSLTPSSFVYDEDEDRLFIASEGKIFVMQVEADDELIADVDSVTGGVYNTTSVKLNSTDSNKSPVAQQVCSAGKKTAGKP